LIWVLAPRAQVNDASQQLICVRALSAGGYQPGAEHQKQDESAEGL
jgi:hypothetical protein